MRVRARRAGEVVETQPEHHRAARARSAARRRRATRSTRPTSDASISSIVVGLAAERALRADRPRGGGRLAPGADRDCARARAGAGRRRGRGSTTSTASPSCGHLADGGDPAVVELGRGLRARRPTAGRPAADAGTRARGRAARRAGRRAWPRRSRPSRGTSCAPTPTVMREARPARAPRGATAPRSRSACPRRASSPPTSRNASSIERPSTSGVVSSNTSNTALLASEYADIRGDTTTARGHRPARLRRAHRRAHAERLRFVARGEHDSHRRRSPAGRAGAGRRAAPPTRRTRRGRRAESSPLRTRTYVRTGLRRSPAAS